MGTLGIVWVHEKHEMWGGGRTEKGDYEFTRGFDVLTETRNVGPFAVLTAQDPKTGLAVPGDFDDYHAGDDALSFAFVKSKTCKRNAEQPKLWQVDVKYSTATETQQRQIAENPLDRPPVYTWDSIEYQKVLSEDKDGRAVTVSTGERPSPLPEIEATKRILRVERNQAIYNDATAVEYEDAVNSDEFKSYGPRKAKMGKISAVSAYENSVFYWKVSYEIKFARETWDVKFLDEGTYYLEGGEKKLFLDARGQVMQTGLLDGSGGALPVGGTPIFRTYQGLKLRAFGPLGL